MTSKPGSTNLLEEIRSDPAVRYYACERSLKLFSLYYFDQYHLFGLPDFHDDFYRDAEFDELVGALWIAFRESAKTSIAKIALIHKICYLKKRFGIWVSYDQRKAESNLYDVAYTLQTNQKIINDFGQLFWDPELELTEEKTRFSKKKSIREFITANKVKVKAYSTGMSIRGEVYGSFRPDFIILDDIETMKTVVSEARTSQVIEFFDEMISGSSGDANFLILGNRLTFSGSLSHIEDTIKGDKEWAVRDIPVINEAGTIAWPQKYALTDAEADRRNAILESLGITDRKRHVISLERKQRQMRPFVYNREMMNQPLTDDEREIKLEWLQKTFTTEQIIDTARNRYICIDVADSKARGKADPDYTGTVVADIDFADNWYVQYVKNRRMNAPELVEWIFYLWLVYKPIKIGIEKKALEDQVMPYIKARSEKDKIYPVIVELQHGGTRKEDRIRGALQGRLYNGKIKFLSGAQDDTDVLKNQLLDFPKAKKDDLADALAYVDQIGARPFSVNSQTKVSELHKEFWANKARLKQLNSPRARILKL